MTNISVLATTKVRPTLEIADISLLLDSLAFLPHTTDAARELRRNELELQFSSLLAKYTVLAAKEQLAREKLCTSISSQVATGQPVDFSSTFPISEPKPSDNSYPDYIWLKYTLSGWSALESPEEKDAVIERIMKEIPVEKWEVGIQEYVNTYILKQMNNPKPMKPSERAELIAAAKDGIGPESV